MRSPFGQVEEVKVGFSWTMFFFGFFVPLCRGDLKYVAITVAGALLTGGLLWLIFPFFYNGIYINGLISKGWKPNDERSQAILLQKGFGDISQF